MRLRHDARDRPTMARDNDCSATFNLVEQLGTVGFSLRGLYFACPSHISISRFDQSLSDARPKSIRSIQIQTEL